MESRVALLARVYEAWNDEGLSAFESLADHFHPTVEFSEASDLPGSGTYRGIAAWRNAMAKQLEGWSAIRFDAEGFEEAGDTVLAVIRAQTTGRTTGIATTRQIFHVVTFRERRIARWRSYFDSDAARAELDSHR